jgi:hypothetical protein
MGKITESNHDQARDYFLRSENYCNIDLPKYFDFTDILHKVDAWVDNKGFTNAKRLYQDVNGKNKRQDPSNCDDVNYLLLSNKDGGFSWRPYEIIHPVLYIHLVNIITDEQNWEFIQGRFKEYANTGVACESIPMLPDDNQKSIKATQVSNWWTNVEQRSIELGLKYHYTFDADITNCYGAMYTHSIAWALHTKKVAKEKRKNEDKLTGNTIDECIRMMRYGQTNGIPQGSALMDFIAEIVLGHLDELLTTEIENDGIEDYKIIRYRDDYRVFTNNPEHGRRIIKHISSHLAAFGMKLNTDKTRAGTDPILSSIKQDKINELFIPNNHMSMQKWLLQIYSAASNEPNTGKVGRMLTRYFDAIDRRKRLGNFDNALAMVSIATNLALKNPKTYQWCMAIISKLLGFCEPSQKLEIIGDIREKFDRLPNTELLDIWLQRISLKIDPTIVYQENRMTLLCRSSSYPGNLFWQTSWLEMDIADIVTDTPIVIKDTLDNIPEIIERAEAELFQKNYF